MSFTMVYEAMEASARLVLNGTRTSASGVVGHKFGPEAGKVTDDTMASGGHAFNAYTSYRNIAVRRRGPARPPGCLPPGCLHHRCDCKLSMGRVRQNEVYEERNPGGQPGELE